MPYLGLQNMKTEKYFVYFLCFTSNCIIVLLSVDIVNYCSLVSRTAKLIQNYRNGQYLNNVSVVVDISPSITTDATNTE